MSGCRTYVYDNVAKYLAKNEDACTLVGKVGAATILDVVAAYNYTFSNMCNLAAFGQSTPREDCRC